MLAADLGGGVVRTGVEAHGHGVPCAWYTYRGHGVTRDFVGARGHGVGSPWARGRRKFRDFVKFDWGKKNWGMGTQDGVDLLAIHQIHGSKSTKTHKNFKLQKNWYGSFCGDFRNWARTSKIRLEN